MATCPRCGRQVSAAAIDNIAAEEGSTHNQVSANFLAFGCPAFLAICTTDIQPSAEKGIR